MDDLIAWANRNAGTLNLVFAFIVAVAAMVTSWFNRRLTRETVALRKAETDPNVAVYLELRADSRHLYDIVVRNIGNGPAYDVSFIISNNDQPGERVTLWRLGFVRNGIKYLAPAQELRTFAGPFNELNIGSITLAATYFDRPMMQARKPQVFRETFDLDVHLLDGGLFMTKGKSADDTIAEQLTNVVQELKRIGKKREPSDA